jgi:hypothetical protein
MMGEAFHHLFDDLPGADSEREYDIMSSKGVRPPGPTGRERIRPVKKGIDLKETKLLDENKTPSTESRWDKLFDSEQFLKVASKGQRLRN